MGKELGLQRRHKIALTDSGNSYVALQAKLDRLIQLIDNADEAIDELKRDMRGDRDRIAQVVTDIENAEFDRKFVEMTKDVSTNLKDATSEISNLHTPGHDFANDAKELKQLHQRLYGRLHAVRSTRRYRTPKPGVFT